MEKPKQTLEERIKRAEQLKERASRRLAQLKARADTRSRREDTRRKIIVGGLVFKWANEDQKVSEWLYSKLKSAVEERDHYLFVGLWPDAKKPAPEPIAGDARLAEMAS